MTHEQHTALDLTRENGPRTVLLSIPSVSPYTLGQDGSFRLATAVMGDEQVVIYEAVAGSDRYPPGRTMRVVLSLAEMDALIEHYATHRAAMEEQQRADSRQWSTHTDDFDPFLDPDELP